MNVVVRQVGSPAPSQLTARAARRRHGGPGRGAQPIIVPRWLSESLMTAYQQGIAYSALAAPLAARGDAAFSSWATARFPARPVQITELEERSIMRSVAATRTPGQTQTARWLSRDGDKEVWEQELAAWQASVSPAQAAWGAQLVAQAREVNATINAAAKTAFGRRRPYIADPQLRTVVARSNASSPSYPSGHSARAFMDATIMGFLNPSRRRAYLALARQMAMSRVYGGVHYPTDVVAGAWEGGLVAAWMIATHPRPAA